MSKITKVIARQVYDSRGNPTVEAEVFSDEGYHATAIVPSGASTGTHEAFELRDKENKNYLGKSVFKAVENINGPISKALNNIDIYDPIAKKQEVKDIYGLDLAIPSGYYDYVLLAVAHDSLVIDFNEKISKFLKNNSVIFDIKGALKNMSFKKKVIYKTL